VPAVVLAAAPSVHARPATQLAKKCLAALLPVSQRGGSARHLGWHLGRSNTAPPVHRTKHAAAQVLIDRAASHALPTEEVQRLGLITIQPPGEEEVPSGPSNAAGVGMDSLPEEKEV